MNKEGNTMNINKLKHEENLPLDKPKTFTFEVEENLNGKTFFHKFSETFYFTNDVFHEARFWDDEPKSILWAISDESKNLIFKRGVGVING